MKKGLKVVIYDPPSGWMYGFPREYHPETAFTPLKETLIKDGYPEKDAEMAAKHTRFWTQGEK